MAYGDFKDLAKTAASIKVFRDKAFNIAKNPEDDRYKKGLASMVYKYFDKENQVSGANNKIEQNQQLAEELHKPIIRKFK